jgi:hypothetical protein
MATATRPRKAAKAKKATDPLAGWPPAVVGAFRDQIAERLSAGRTPEQALAELTKLFGDDALAGPRDPDGLDDLCPSFEPLLRALVAEAAEGRRPAPLGPNRPEPAPAGDAGHFRTIPDAGPDGPTPQQVKAVAALVAGKTAAEAGVSSRTLYRWQRDDVVFVAALNAARGELIDSTRAALRALGGEAVATVQAVMTDPATPPAVRLTAAFKVLGCLRADAPAVAVPDQERDPEGLAEHRREVEAKWARYQEQFGDLMSNTVEMPTWTVLTVRPGREPVR